MVFNHHFQRCCTGHLYLHFLEHLLAFVSSDVKQRGCEHHSKVGEAHLIEFVLGCHKREESQQAKQAVAVDRREEHGKKLQRVKLKYSVLELLSACECLNKPSGQKRLR